MALELDGEDTLDTTGGAGPTRLAAGAGLVWSSIRGKEEIVKLDDSACILLSERVTDSNLPSDGDGDVMEDWSWSLRRDVISTRVNIRIFLIQPNKIKKQFQEKG